MSFMRSIGATSRRLPLQSAVPQCWRQHPLAIAERPYLRFYTAAAPPPQADTTDRPRDEDADTAKEDNDARQKLESLETALEISRRETADMRHKYQSALADFQNLQERSRKAEKAAKDFAVRSFAKDLVSDIEVLRMALDSIPADHRTADQRELKELWEGVDSTKKLLEKTLSRFGVVPFDPTGQKFDPNKHDALYKAPVPGKESNTVVCSKVGWMLHDQVLRPAQVGVVA